jgi:hypothetical protein
LFFFAVESLFFAVEQLVMTDCVTKASPEQERMTNERNTKDEKKNSDSKN